MGRAYPDRDVANGVFAYAVGLARSAAELPVEWIALVERFGSMKTRGYLVALGTALLAKATDDKIDPLALQLNSPVRPGRRGYSARTFCSQVLVKQGRSVELDLGLHGDEPLQGNPFTDEERLHRKLPVMYPGELDQLVTALEAIDEMNAAEARTAFAAYVRVRTNLARPADIQLPTALANLPELIAATEAFAFKYSERSRIGQAIVAGALDLILIEVKTTNVYASSKSRPGDVRVETLAGTTMAAEVKQKAVDADQVKAFARELGRAWIRRGMYIAMARDQRPLPTAAIAAAALSEGVAFSTHSSLTQFLGTVVALAPSEDAFVRDFPRNVMGRLLELGASEEARTAWAAAVAGATGVPDPAVVPVSRRSPRVGPRVGE